MSDRFIAHMLARNIRIEEDLVDQLFNSSEKRLARALLLLARYGKVDKPVRVVPKISQSTLAEMVGTTRSRVNFFLNKFKRLGFIEYTAELPLKINNSLLSVVLRDTQQGVVDLERELSSVFDETQSLELVEEEVHPRTRRPDHLRERRLGDLRHHADGFVLHPVTRQQQQRARQPLLARIEELIDQV